MSVGGYFIDNFILMTFYIISSVLGNFPINQMWKTKYESLFLNVGNWCDMKRAVAVNWRLAFSGWVLLSSIKKDNGKCSWTQGYKIDKNYRNTCHDDRLILGHWKLV